MVVNPPPLHLYAGSFSPSRTTPWHPSPCAGFCTGSPYPSVVLRARRHTLQTRFVQQFRAPRTTGHHPVRSGLQFAISRSPVQFRRVALGKPRLCGAFFVRVLRLVEPIEVLGHAQVTARHALKRAASLFVSLVSLRPRLGMHRGCRLAFGIHATEFWPDASDRAALPAHAGFRRFLRRQETVSPTIRIKSAGRGQRLSLRRFLRLFKRVNSGLSHGHAGVYFLCFGGSVSGGDKRCGCQRIDGS